MSLNRLSIAHKIIASSKNITYRARACRANVAPLVQFARWQSSRPPAGGLSVLRVLIYGASTTGLVIGGSLVYANYNPSFRYKADEYIPGFAQLADFAADKWVDIIDTIKPKSTEKVRLKDFGSKFDSKLSSPKQDKAKKDSPSVEHVGTKEDKPRSKEALLKESDKGDSILELVNKQAQEVTIDEPAVSASPSLSPKKSTELVVEDAPRLADRDSVQVSNQQIKEKKEDKESVVFDKVEELPQPEMVTEITVGLDVPVESDASAEHVGPCASVESAMASVKATKTAIEIQSEQIKELQSAQSSDTHFHWLEDAAQAEVLLQEVYDRYRDWNEKTNKLQEILIQTEKHRQDKYAQAMKTSTDDEAVVQTIAEDMVKADEDILSAEKNVTASQVETSKVGQELALLLDRASGLGLKSKVEEIRSELSKLHARTTMGDIDYAEERVSSSVMGEYQNEVEKVKDWIKTELGTTLPQADSQQEAVVLMLKKRVDLLLQKLNDAEKDYQGHLADALLKQKEELEQLAEKKVQVHLQVQEQEIWREAQKKQNKALHEKDEELKEQLLTQTAAHTQHLSEALQAQAEQLGTKWASQTEKKLIQQEIHYQKELVKAMARLKGIEAMVDTVANAGEKTRRQQGLRTACDTLNGTLEQADLNTDSNKRHSFMKEVIALQEAARGDYFILAALDSIPHEAVTHGLGIQSEAGLRQRFKKVKRVCRQVSLVPVTGGGLGTYALSYIHSLLTFDLLKYTDSPKHPADMDTSELLQAGNALLEQGDMEGAVRLLNYLQGEPKRVAQDWLRDAQLHLETKQAILLVQNYMASVSLSIIQ